MKEENEHKKPPKELIDILEKRLYIKPDGIKQKTKEVEKVIEDSIKPGKRRFEKLIVELDKVFPIGTPLREGADGITYYLFDSALELYFIGNNSALFVELHGLLERFCINRACEYLAVDSQAKSILQDSFSKKTLSDIAEYFQTISFWSDEEVRFVKRLTQIRNGIAHKNAELVSKYLSDGKQAQLTSIDDITKKADATPFIISVIQLIMKVVDVQRPAFFSNPRFVARLEAYSSIIGLIMNLFIDREFLFLPNPVKFTMLNRLVGRAILLGSKNLDDYFATYKIKLLEFHDSLNVDDVKAASLHKELIELGDKIYDQMREDLKIDGDPSYFTKPNRDDIDLSQFHKLIKPN